MNVIQDIEARLKQFIGLNAGSLGPSAVSSAVRIRMNKRNVSHAEEYAAMLAASEDELQELIENIVVSETWFFRDRQPFFALARWAVETWLPAHPQGVLRLLSAPCATGEEPFSMVMAMLDAGVPPERFVVEAVDISLLALARTRRGVYGRNSFRSRELEFRDRYFRPVAEGWQLDEAVRRQVQFRQANILEPSFIGRAGMKDVIFCRNMLIYFDEPAQRRLMTALDNLLSPDGLLFVGHAETFIFRDSAFSPAQMPMAFALRKRGVEPPRHKTTTPHRHHHRAEPQHLPAVHRRMDGRSLPAFAVKPMIKPSPPPGQAKTESLPDLATELAEIRKMADAGRFKAAIQKCNACLQAHGPSSHTFYLLGLVNDASGNIAHASDCYRKAVYLEPDHYEALAQLSLLAKKSGDAAAARQWSQRAQRAHEKQAAKRERSHSRS